ncbi:hypothetical protein HaLaN_18920, partial [Haematococcus lacustris]
HRVRCQAQCAAGLGGATRAGSAHAALAGAGGRGARRGVHSGCLTSLSCHCRAGAPGAWPHPEHRVGPGRCSHVTTAALTHA